jgi:hypothetical protein
MTEAAGARRRGHGQWKQGLWIVSLCLHSISTMCQPHPLSERSADRLMAQAMDYRRMALTATTIETQESLIKLAIRLVSLAAQRKREEMSAK